MTQPMPIKLEFTGKVAGDKISGSVKLGAFGHAAPPPTKYEAAFGHGARRTSGHRFPSAVCEAGLWRRSRLRASKGQWDHRKQAFVVQIQRSGAFIQLHWQRS